MVGDALPSPTAVHPCFIVIVIIFNFVSQPHRRRHGKVRFIVIVIIFIVIVSPLDRDVVETEMMMEASDTEIEMWEESDKEEYRLGSRRGLLSTPYSSLGFPLHLAYDIFTSNRDFPKNQSATLGQIYGGVS